MRHQKRSPKALLQLGEDVHIALDELAQRIGCSKSETVRKALLGALAAEQGYWEELLFRIVGSLWAEILPAVWHKGWIQESTLREAQHILRKIGTEMGEALGEGDTKRTKGSFRDMLLVLKTRSALLEPEMATLRRWERGFRECRKEK